MLFFYFRLFETHFRFIFLQSTWRMFIMHQNQQSNHVLGTVSRMFYDTNEMSIIGKEGCQVTQQTLKDTITIVVWTVVFYGTMVSRGGHLSHVANFTFSSLFNDMSSLDQLSSSMSATVVQTNQEQRKDERFIHGSSIEAFYADSVILITGATGFLGKALVEKLLRSCSRLIAIFILIRPKRGQTVDQRLTRLLQNSVFDRLRTENPSALNKIHPMKGDVTMSDLGLSPADKETLIQRVNIVFHSAATVRFDEPLKVAVNLNTKGTDRMIELCKSMKNLISFIHVSTAYSNANLNEINEAIYTTKVKPSTVIEMCEGLDDSTIDILEKNILENHPNTYTFTKNLAEQLLLAKATKLPLAVVRPSIIGAAMEEPYPGWVDTPIGITGILKEVARGTLKSALCFAEKAIDVVPVDYVVDTLICAAWHRAMEQNNSIKIYNCTAKNPFAWGQLLRFTVKYARLEPVTHLVWYPGISLARNKFPVEVLKYTCQYFPALVYDFFYGLMGHKPVCKLSSD
ncbi:putative fatty acyl-CoA reductase CG5065 isoform X4 [Lasioglossum baleicum]|uniref:putative fatty acyl-CoA reductase CG5065 isoform X4 n=1 Tax=Lasioglossum baleicum TaxID=434251 RepID=UPI003FCD1CFF